MINGINLCVIGGPFDGLDMWLSGADIREFTHGEMGIKKFMREKTSNHKYIVRMLNGIPERNKNGYYYFDHDGPILEK